MKAIVTGASGTVGRALCALLRAEGHEPIPWDRSVVPIDDYHAMENFVRAEEPDALFHLAVASQPSGREDEGWWVNWHWTSELAWISRVLDVHFVFTSTVMVFTDRARGPFRPSSEPDALEGYGAEKLAAEQRVWHQNPDAHVVRLGWQIGTEASGNTMSAHLARQAAEGPIRASRRWLPACSFLEDTARGLVEATVAPPGLYLLDSNRRWSYFEIVHALRERLGTDWVIAADDAFAQDQRMIDDRLGVPSLAERLPALRSD